MKPKLKKIKEREAGFLKVTISRKDFDSLLYAASCYKTVWSQDLYERLVEEFDKKDIATAEFPLGDSTVKIRSIHFV